MQTVILDSCHAASATRWTEDSDFRVRGFDLPTDRTLTASRSGGAIARSASRTMSSSPSSGWTTSDISSHVLLAATSSSCPAREQGESGLFTRALLNLLRDIRKVAAALLRTARAASSGSVSLSSGGPFPDCSTSSSISPSSVRLSVPAHILSIPISSSGSRI
jgi:hypothetical protein